MNPYDWQRHQPEVEVPRPAVAEIAGKLARGKSGVLLAGRGMGKSVFLRQVAAELEKHEDLGVLLFAEPPTELSARSYLDALGTALGVEVSEPLGVRPLIESWLRAERRPARLVLLYDEFDRYGQRSTTASTSSAGRDFFNNLESVRRDYRELGILAAGSLGVYVFRDVLGSSFLARAESVRLQPFSLEQVEQLARPFVEDERPLSEETLAALRLAAGVNPALLTYGLESLWPIDSPNEHDVAKVFARFREEQREFLRDVELSFADPALSEAPQRVLDLVLEARGPVPHAELKQACEGAGPLRLSFGDVLDLLQAAGFLRIHGSLSVDPVDVRPIASLLSLPAAGSAATALQEQLSGDLGILLSRLHAAGADFFRPGRRGKQLVPESVFAAFLAMGFEMLGWQVEREAQHGAGRTDLKMRWNGGASLAVVELKIWGHPGFREAQAQIEKYWSAGVAAGAVVVITDTGVDDWPEAYRRQCLARYPSAVASQPPESPITACYAVDSETQDGTAVRVDHFLLRLPR